MNNGPSEDLYREEVRRTAETLEEIVHDVVVTKGDFDDPEKAAVEMGRDAVGEHHWFDGGNGPAFHGAIIELSDADPGDYTDLDAYTEGKDVDGIVRVLAYLCFEADVIEAADVSGIGNE